MGCAMRVGLAGGSTVEVLQDQSGTGPWYILKHSPICLSLTLCCLHTQVLLPLKWLLSFTQPQEHATLTFAH